VEPKIERGNRVFPVSDKAVDIVDALVRFATKNGAKLRQGRATALLLEDGAVKGVKTEDGDTIFADRVIVATGGMSYPLTGSTGDGYTLAKQAGHTIAEPKPSLVPLVCHEGFCSDLQGLSLRNVELSLYEDEQIVYKQFGEMLFTHDGIPGPLVLSASARLSRSGPRGS
jgi:predicted Rossmann fold flavoprotein